MVTIGIGQLPQALIMHDIVELEYCSYRRFVKVVPQVETNAILVFTRLQYLFGEKHH